MPFKLKLKKSRQYSVVSKTLFVISIEMLDGTNIECTLSSESTGQDCLDVVCQKLGLTQSKFFGLQYTAKNENYFWVELERPIKRQLDKYARNLSVHLRVMYYIISGARLLHDEISRYHYFLQLKLDVIEGRISCSAQQAVELASYSMQAEFGNYDAERHTAHYLKDFQLFPKSFTDVTLLEALTDAASRQHATLLNLPQSTAEEYYICACQQLEGYGQEIFAVKDRLGDDAIISVSLTEVSIGYASAKEGHRYGWTDIKNVINHKRDFVIETVSGQKVDFQFADAESAKNAWRFCVLQHTFYRQYEVNDASNTSRKQEGTSLPNHSRELLENRIGAKSKSAPIVLNVPLDNTIFTTAGIHNELIRQSQEDVRYLGSSLNITNENGVIQMAPKATPPHHVQFYPHPSISNLPMPVDRSHSVSTQSLNWQTHKAQSTSCLDLYRSGNIEHLRNLLPTYRPAPDYETAMQHKYRHSTAGVPSLRNNSPGHPHTHQPNHNAGVVNAVSLLAPNSLLYNSSSQPDIHQRYPDVVNNGALGGQALYNFHNSLGISRVIPNAPHYYLYKPPPPYPTSRLTSNSTPDLATLAHYGRRIPTSIVQQLMSGSSPDLVSRNGGVFLSRHPATPAISTNFCPHAHLAPRMVAVAAARNVTAGGGTGAVHSGGSENLSSARQHGTYENLTSLLGNGSAPVLNEVPTSEQQCIVASISRANTTAADTISALQRPFEKHARIMYGYVPSSQPLSTTSKVVHEPIYENVPLSWQNLTKDPVGNDTSSRHRSPTIPVHTPTSPAEELIKGFNAMHLKTSEATDSIDIGGVMSRTSTLIINHDKDNNNSVFKVNELERDANFEKMVDDSINRIQNDSSSTTATTVDTSAYTTSNDTASSNSSKTKKRRWGILMVGSSSNSANNSKEKIKCATLGREKHKDRSKSGTSISSQNTSQNKYRWSTGMPKFHPIPPSLSKEAMCQLLEVKLSDPKQLLLEFEKIPQKKNSADCTTALHPDNSTFNRFRDVLPYEENRIRLTPTKRNKFGYINASQITATVGSKQRFYIAAQGPTRSTLPYFWQCVWEAEVYLVVQLTDRSLGEQIDYMPNGDSKESQQRCMDVGDEFQVWWEFGQTSGHCITSKVRLCHVQSRRYRTLWHLHYTDWGEDGCPQSIAHFLGFLEEMQSVQQHSMAEIPPGHNKNPPVLAHCTAGVGRTGLTILSDLLLYTVDHNQEVCIPRLVKQLRYQRPNMVQTIAQYRFVYSLLVHYLKQTRLI